VPSSLRDALAADHPDFGAEALPPTAWIRLERLDRASPLYGQMLRRTPALCLWLDDPRTLQAFSAGSFRASWNWFAASLAAPGDDDETQLGRLRQWRRRMSLRIAFRSVNSLSDEATTVAELSLLAEFCLGECLRRAQERWGDRLGEPWDDDNRRPARFCILALGKLGGGELNFSSDIDLIYCYEGDGHCRRAGAPTPTETVEFFTKVAETVTTQLTARTGDGFLFRVDVRLRPEGAWSPLVRSLSAIENYYSSTGQTWERLALIKARPVAGDLALGAELLEDLHSFRYPRRPPPSLLAEVAAMKVRSEREIVGEAALERDLKRGSGGIREIEFIAQSLQLLHAGRFPFLQTHATATALEGLARYGILESDDARFLTSAYWELRQVEHRLQMREEDQTHRLPEPGAELSAIAASLGFASAAAFTAGLKALRERVHGLYSALFSDRSLDPEFEMWWEFFTTPRVPGPVADRISRWFGPEASAADALRLFAVGGHRPQITRDLVVVFQHLARHFDSITPQLAQPQETLVRLGRCAERYGTRRQFLENCAANPQLFRVLALVCDRSTYGVELLCAHPEILEEVLRPEMLRRRKSPADLAAELALGPEPYAPWLWLYVRAETLRSLIGELLGFIDQRAVEAALSQLADAVLLQAVAGSGLLIVALGKYGGQELTFGSDLDLLLVADPGATGEAAAGAERLRHLLAAGNPLGPTFALDLRLRPYGAAGPLLTTLPDLAAYHRKPEVGGPGSAQTWEKQMLTRARVVTGPPGLAAAFRAWVETLLYAQPLSAAEAAEIWQMRERIERERDTVVPPERAFKTGRGGLIEIEFVVQSLQLRHGHAFPSVRSAATRAALRALGEAGLLAVDTVEILLANFEFLKRIEFALRRDANQGISVLAATPAGREPLARWLGFPTETAFWAEYTARLGQTRAQVAALGFMASPA